MGETHWRMLEGRGASMGTRTGVGKAGNRTMLSTLQVNMAKPGLNTASGTEGGQTPIMLLFVSVL